jgi:hypothetical protein
MTIQEAIRQIDDDFRHGYHRMEAGYPEVNSLNDHQRDLIGAMRDAHGHCWLGHINLHNCRCGHGWTEHAAWKGACGNCACSAFAEDRPLWPWDGGLVYNFGGAFVIPDYDATLERLILERADAPYTGTRADSVRVTAIMDRILALGGHHLFWN